MIKTETIKTSIRSPRSNAFYINLDAESFEEIFITYKGQKYKINKSLLMYYLKSFGLINIQVGDDEDEDS